MIRCGSSEMRCGVSAFYGHSARISAFRECSVEIRERRVASTDERTAARLLRSRHQRQVGLLAGDTWRYEEDGATPTSQRLYAPCGVNSITGMLRVVLS